MATRKNQPARNAPAKNAVGQVSRAHHAAGTSSTKEATKAVTKKEPPKRRTRFSSADRVDELLGKYRSMRNFSVTAEPPGTGQLAAEQALPFCIQKHAASHLHYDFRLGWQGVLKSWAVAKGPSYVVRDRRLAVQVEDHPMEYGGFEGIIPAGQYGGGTVMLWDHGTWAPQPGHEDIDAGLREGSLKFVMYGEKIRGRWTLVRMGGKAATERKPNWLLIKEHDDFERTADAPAITDSEVCSVATGRTIEEIAAQKDHVWNSKETAGPGQAWYRQISPDGMNDRAALSRSKAGSRLSPGTAPSPQALQLSGLPPELQPSFIKPQLALETTAPPEGDAWFHELKLDGYRMQARKSGSSVAMLTRSGLDWTYRVPAIARAVGALPVESATLDGEVVVLAEDGTTDFARLQASFQEGVQHPLTFFCFDLLHISGFDPRGLPLRRRKEILASLVPTDSDAEVRFSEHIKGSGAAMFRRACELHAEGIISKQAEAPYRPDRGHDWLKSKCLREQEFVVGGFTLSSDGPDLIGSLLLGYYRDGKLIYAGRTGTGFTRKLKQSLRGQLSRLECGSPPFVRLPSEAKRGALWVRPELVAQVRFATWTAEDLIRQAAFLGLREDKNAAEVVREEPTVAPKPKAARSPRSAPAKPLAEPGLPSPQPAATFSIRARRAGAASVEQPASPKSPVSMASPVGDWAAFSHPPVRLTHPGKILDPETHATKQMLADFYWAVADRMLPHIAGRPLSLVRCPEGASKPCFYQKHVNHMLPPGVTSTPVPDKKTGVVEPYITLSTPDAVAGLAQMGVLEIHPWGSTNSDLEHANRIVFDLDPDETLAWADVARAALEVRDRLKQRKLTSFLKTTGGKGLHVVVPIAPIATWDQVKVWARQFVVNMERDSPQRFLTKMTKAARSGRIYLDYLRNERGATAVAPYSPRARAGLGVSLPLRWSELSSLERPVFQVSGFPTWSKRLLSDPWSTLSKLDQRLL